MATMTEQEKQDLVNKWNAGTASVDEVARMNEQVFGMPAVGAREMAAISLGESDGDATEG
jgi:hypothetical protein